MATLTLRNVKGSALTFQEGDSNYLALDSDSPWSVAADYIHYDGNVGIGPNSSNPTYQVDFANGIANEATIGTADADLNVHVNGPRKFKVTTNGTERVTLSTTGKFGIGQTDPQFELDVGGYANVSNTLTSNSIETNSFTDGTLSISGGSILNAKRIVSTTQIDFTQFYDRSTGLRVNQFDSTLTAFADRLPTSFAVRFEVNRLDNALDSESSYLRNRLDSEHAWNNTNHIILQDNIDSNHTSLLSKENQLQLNIDSVNSSLISKSDSLQDQIDSLNDKFGASGLQQVTDISSTTTNKISITNAGGIESPRISGSHQGFAGIEFNTTDIVPINSSGTVANDVVSLGTTSNKFKDGYFSGTVNTVTASVSGTMTGGTITDGSATLTGGALNATTITAGSTITGGTIVKSGGTSSQYLKADGSTSTDANVIAGSVEYAITFDNSGAGAASGTYFNGSAERTISYNTIGAPSITGTDASGTWDINVTGNAATATTADKVANSFTVQGTAFDGSAPKTVTFTGGTGITVSGTTITNDLGGTPVSIAGGGATTISGSYPAFTVSSVNTTYSAGSGLSLSGTTFTNAAPDQTVVINGGGATSVSGTYPNFTISSTDTNTTYAAGTGLSLSGTTFTNTAPDRTVTISGAGATTVTGSYPNFTITSTDTNTNTTYTAGSGLTLSGTQFINAAPDRTVSLTGSGGIAISGTYPNFTIDASGASGAAYTAGNGLTLTGTAFAMSGSFNGTLTCTGDVVAFSDVALKSNINPITEALNKVGRIGGYTYNKLGDEEKRTGVLAQEIQKVLPEAVHTNEDGVLGVAYGNLTALLIEAVKELNAKVKDLESKLGV